MKKVWQTLLVLNWANFCFVNLVQGIRRTAMKLCLGSRSFAQHVQGIFAQISKPCRWLADSKESSSMDEEERKGKWMMVSMLHSLQREMTYLLTCGRYSLVSGTQNDIAVSRITLYGIIQICWLDFSQHFRSCCGISAASSGRSLHLIISQLRTKYSSSSCLKYAQQTSS